MLPEQWKGRDPIARLAKKLLDLNVLDEAQLNAIAAAAVTAVDGAEEFAKASPYPDVSSAFTQVSEDNR